MALFFKCMLSRIPFSPANMVTPMSFFYFSYNVLGQYFLIHSLLIFLTCERLLFLEYIHFAFQKCIFFYNIGSLVHLQLYLNYMYLLYIKVFCYLLFVFRFYHFYLLSHTHIFPFGLIILFPSFTPYVTLVSVL